MEQDNLSLDEKEILESYENDEWRPIEKLDQEILRMQKIARATVKKDARVNIRISSKDLTAIQKKALEEGIPYQTLITSVLHKYIEGRFRDHSQG